MIPAPFRKSRLWTVAAIVLAAVLVFVNAARITPPNFILVIFAGTPVFCAALSGRRWFLWTITALMMITAWGVIFIYGPDIAISSVGYFGIQHWVWNRFFAGVAVIPIAILADLLMISRAQVAARMAQLETQNHELETLSEELTSREEELFRQNEQMQAQNEELERQSEELRVTNEELGRREKTLERLLDLSRALAAETTHLNDNEVMSRICEAVVQLTEADAGAILMREGDEIIVRCQHGFSPSVLSMRMPFDNSFASLVMSRLQTGYIEDLQLRPDLRLLEPARRFRSIAATPLRVRGRLVGALELYASDARLWSPDQIALLESLAAQASVSLETVDLFAAVQQERRRFETAFRTLPLPVFVAEDPRCNLVRMNPAASVLLNASTDTNISPFSPEAARPRMQLFRNGQLVQDSAQPLLRAVLRGEQILNEEYEILLQNNDRRVLLMSAAPVYDSRGLVSGGVCVGADITVVKRLQQELEIRRRDAEEASLRKTRFLAAISHDIRTPVNAINLTAELVRRAHNNPSMKSEIPGMVSDLRTNAQSLSVLVNDLLDMARFDSGKVEFQDSEFSLGELISDEIRQLLPLAQDKGLLLSADGSQAAVSLWLRTDRVKLGRILANLIGNAIKFTEAGSITIAVSAPPNDGVIIRVQDTGMGIAPEHLPRIFDEFTQLRNPERDRYKGTGLGLAISKRLIEAVGGTITVDSTLGKGSTFAVHLPGAVIAARKAEAPVLNVPLGDGSPSLDGLSILLVEDHATTRWATAQILAAEGASVYEAPDAATALAMLDDTGRNHPPVDVMLLDMMLPDMDGQEVLRRLNTNRPAHLRSILVLTGDCTPERSASVRSLGADALVPKPIDIPHLLTLLRGTTK